MKPGPNPKQRPRGRVSPSNPGNGGPGGPPKRLPPRNATYDSNGPDIRIRGNAHQVLEKYLAMARDASAQGDRITAENYYQHAEHYFRLINAQNQQSGRYQRPAQTPADDHSLLASELYREEREDGENPDHGGASGSEAPEPIALQVIDLTQPIPGEEEQPDVPAMMPL